MENKDLKQAKKFILSGIRKGKDFDREMCEFCKICKLNKTCQMNFDYECIEASDFLYSIEIKSYTVKDNFLDSLINKSNKALRG